MAIITGDQLGASADSLDGTAGDDQISGLGATLTLSNVLLGNLDDANVW